MRLPSRAALDAARDTTIPDVLADGLDVVFCGINPSLASAALGAHFARPGNRFWPALHGAGFTPRQLDPSEQRELLSHGVGITNLVARATATAAELSRDEIRAGADRLRRRVGRRRPRALAVLGIGAYRTGFGARAAQVGPQDVRIGATIVWVLPNPSGLNASYQLPELITQYRRLRRALR